MIASDFFVSNYLIGHFISGFVDNSIGALSYFVDALVALHFGASWAIADHVNELKIIIKINKNSLNNNDLMDIMLCQFWLISK